MRSPVGEIRTAFETALSSVKYNKSSYQFVKALPKAGIQRYIFINNIDYQNDWTKDTYIHDCNIDVEVGHEMHETQINYVEVDNIMDKVLRLVCARNALTFTNFTMYVPCINVNSFRFLDENGSKTTIREIITLAFKLQQNDQI